MTEPSLAIGIVAAAVVATAAFVAKIFDQRMHARQRLEEKEFERIAQLYEKEFAVRKAAAVEVAVERIPHGTSVQQMPELIEAVFNRLSPTIGVAVENLINGYHQQALSQAGVQFWFSVAAATVGFGSIIYAGTGIRPEDLSTVLGVVPGVLIDAVAYLFFGQAAATRARATDLYDRLRRDKQVSESVALVASIEDVRVRSAVQAQIALHMSGLQPLQLDLSGLLATEPRTPEASAKPN